MIAGQSLKLTGDNSVSQSLRSLSDIICRMLKGGEGIVLSTVVARGGSTPRSVGTRMVVFPNGDISGTVGGGSLEAVVIKTAMQVVETTKAQILTFDLTDSSLADDPGMICGGQVVVLLEWIVANENNINLFSELAGSLRGDHGSVYITKYFLTESAGFSVEHCLTKGTNIVLGDMTLPVAVKEKLVKQPENRGAPISVKVENNFFLIEPIFSAGTVYLFGAGHVSREVAELAGKVDFRVVVVDDRAEYASSERFGFADEIHAVERFENVFAGLDIDKDSYIVIATRGHRHDKTVLGQALLTEAGYVGMIGSRTKREAIYSALKREGVSAEDIERVHSPIGLTIGAETLAEISVSIVAELIAHRARIRSGFRT